MQKKTITLLLLLIATISVLSCVIVDSTFPPYPLSLPQFSWKRLYHKNDLKKFDRAIFSLDGEHYIVSDDYRFIHLWNRSSPTPLQTVKLKIGYESIVELNYFGHQNDVFLAKNNDYVQLWDQKLQTKKFEYHFETNIKKAAISRDGRFVANNYELYDRQKKQLIGRTAGLALHNSLYFGDSSLLVTSGYHEQAIAVRNIFSGEYSYRTVSDPVSDAAISPNEKYAIAITKKGRCYVWNWPEKKPNIIRTVKAPSGFGGFSPDSKWFGIATSKYLQIFQTKHLQRIAKIKIDHGISTLQIVSNNLIITANRAGSVQFINVSDAKVIASYKALGKGIGAIKFIRDKGYLWVASAGYYNIQTKKNDGEIAMYHIDGLEPYYEAPN